MRVSESVCVCECVIHVSSYLLQAVVMLVMYFEAMVVLYRQTNHFRITRCLRPIFFIDTYLMFGVRRYSYSCCTVILPVTRICLYILLTEY